MFCENCGTKMEDGDLFCPNCGKKIELPAAQSAQSVSQAEQSVPKSESASQVNTATQQATVSVAEPQKQETAQQEPPMNPYAQQPQNPYVQQPQQNPYAMPNGQQQFAPKPKKSNFKITKQMVIIGSSVLAVVIVAVIVISILVSNANNPVNKMVNAINSGDYQSAEEIYYDNIGALMDNETVIEAIQKQVDAVETDYKNGTIDYDTAMGKLDDISDLPMSYETTIADVKYGMYELKESADNLKSGNKYLEDKEYSNAIYYYNKVLEKDTANYKKAQEQKTKAIDGIRQQYLDEAKKYAEKNEYSYAVSSLQNGLDNDYLQNDDKLKKQIDAYVDEVIKKSEEYASAKKYDAAEEIINSVANGFENDSDNYKKLEAQMTKIQTEQPAYLQDMDINNSDYFYRYQNGSKDVVGNTYDSGNVCTMSVSKYYKNPYAEMYVKDYKKVKGTIAVKQNSGSAGDITAHIEILDDNNKVLYKSETLTGKSKPVEFEVNITDVEWLTIKLVNTKADSNGTMNVILADVEFYKIDSSEPDAPVTETSTPEASKEESSQAETSKAESSSAETSKTESSKPESSKEESSKAESSKVESSKAA